MSQFDPNGVGVANGNVFGFPVSLEEADLVIIPVPWDVTASYKKGTSRGPVSILEASTQLDFYHPLVENAAYKKVHMLPISDDWVKLNDKYNGQLKPYFEALENGDSVDEFANLIAEVNAAQDHLKENLKERCLQLFQDKKKVAVLGGEHSSPLGLIEALAEQTSGFGILQVDAHADLRIAYEGFEQSHASIMNRVLNVSELEKLVQLGVRDLSNEEMQCIQTDPRILCYSDWELRESTLSGTPWSQLCKEIIDNLPDQVYVSFDIDGLEPSLCPNTGTPVPGGLRFEEIRFLLHQLKLSDKQVVGFDLCEVAPGYEDDWDANVGARVLWELVQLID